MATKSMEILRMPDRPNYSFKSESQLVLALIFTLTFTLTHSSIQVHKK